MQKTLLLLVLTMLLATGCNQNAIVAQNNPTASNNTSISSSTFTMSDVETANNANKCWTVINGSVYDLTNWINKHPGGQEAILSICGKDGTSAF